MFPFTHRISHNDSRNLNIHDEQVQTIWINYSEYVSTEKSMEIFYIQIIELIFVCA